MDADRGRLEIRRPDLLNRCRRRTYSATFAYDAIEAVLKGESEEKVLDEYSRRVGDGVDAWYDLIALFYKLQNLFTVFAVRKRFREKVVRILQGNLYMEESLQRAREMIDLMEESYGRIMNDPSNLLRAGAMWNPDELELSRPA